MHVFVQHLDGKRVRELHWRDDELSHGVGFVVRSDYFPVAERGLWAWLTGRPSEPRWQLPFDEAGADSLRLTTRIPEGCRRITGRISAAATETLVRDAWSNDPAPWRVSEACDFIVAPEVGPAMVVSLGLAPIVIAPPRLEQCGDVIASLAPRHLRLLPKWLEPASGTSSRVELRAGDLVEVIGVSRPVRESSRRLDRVGYRDGPQPRDVIGDDDGTRVVLRLLQ